MDVSNYPHLQGLALADTFSSSDKEIGILIGADHYHDIVTGEVIKGSLGPIATSSKLGWLLSGTISSCETENVCSNVVTSFVIEVLPRAVVMAILLGGCKMKILPTEWVWPLTEGCSFL